MYLKQNSETGYWTSCYTRDEIYVGELVNVHPIESCGGARGCAIHDRPSDHPLKEVPLFWNDEWGILERLCEHRVGHPDPDSALYLESIGQGVYNIHTCDGCCG